ncbi:MAG: biotin--[acetyl-CoA-carboxylase] ligase [Bdellovibrionota bacterium]
MNILAFDSLDSTSTHAARLLDANEAVPFAVIAKSQTQGRGRSGRSWESPKGGLYLTLVLPPSHHPDPKNPGCLPLWVASQTALWIQKTWSVRITIKWPNDLLFAGRKLGGILCEGRMHGRDLGPLIIGIGINLHDAPDVSEQESVALEGILKRPVSEDAFDLARSLAEFLSTQSLKKTWRDDYRYFGLESGQLFDDGQSVHSLYDVTDEGAMQLIDLKSKELKTLNSVSHGFRWVYQQKNPMIVADIGNSLVKVGYFPDASNCDFEILRLDLRDESLTQSLAEFFESRTYPKPWIVHGITVASRPWEKLSEALKTHQLTLVPVPKRSIRVDYGAYNFAQLGIDRVALSEAAKDQFPSDGVLVVSAGTCITIEALTAKGEYLGGHILPGLQTKLNSLHLRTDRLPLLKIYEERLDNLSLFGHDTKDAMLSGIIHETVALIDYLKRQMPENSRLVFTGGDGQILNRFIAGDYREALTLEGIRLMAKGGAIC